MTILIDKRKDFEEAAGKWISVVWVDGWKKYTDQDVPEDEIAKLKIAKVDNINFRRATRDAIFKQKVTTQGRIEPSLTNEDLIDLIAETVLLDWEGIGFYGESGEVISKYSKATAKKLFELDPSFLDFVCDLSRDPEEFPGDEARVKNLPNA